MAIYSPNRIISTVCIMKISNEYYYILQIINLKYDCFIKKKKKKKWLSELKKYRLSVECTMKTSIKVASMNYKYPVVVLKRYNNEIYCL